MPDPGHSRKLDQETGINRIGQGDSDHRQAVDEIGLDTVRLIKLPKLCFLILEQLSELAINSGKEQYHQDDRSDNVDQQLKR